MVGVSMGSGVIIGVADGLAAGGDIGGKDAGSRKAYHGSEFFLWQHLCYSGGIVWHSKIAAVTVAVCLLS